MDDRMQAVVPLATLKEARDFQLAPDADARAAIADRLDLSALKKLRFAGRLEPVGEADWRLDAQLGATVVQPCAVTLEPVTTRIDNPVARTYLAHMPEPEEGSEVEMPDNDEEEPLPRTLDLTAVMEEALSLAVPDFPRAEGVEMPETRVTEPGKTPMSDDDAKPFAGLADLRAKLGEGGTDGSGS